jgi:hypothetical protein
MLAADNFGVRQAWSVTPSCGCHFDRETALAERTYAFVAELKLNEEGDFIY